MNRPETPLPLTPPRESMQTRLSSAKRSLPPSTAPSSPIDRVMQDLPFDAGSRAFHEDPHQFFEALRAQHGPLYRTPSGDLLVLGHQAAVQALRDPRFGHGAQKSTDLTSYGVPARSFLLTDPPGHGQQRERIRKAFNVREVTRLRPLIEREVASLLARASSQGQADVVADIARPLSSRVLAELIGMPAQYRASFQQYAETLVRATDPPHLIDAQTQALIARARVDFARDILAILGESTHGGVIQALLEHQARGQWAPASRREIVATCGLLVAAGYETTVALIANGMHALLSHPREVARLRSAGFAEDIVEGMIEELVRYDPPFQLAPRSALVDADLCGQPVARGTILVVVLAAANRDPAVFPSPQRLDVLRRPHHLAFGLGPHLCPGATLARLQAKVTLTALLRHDPQPSGHVVRYGPGRVARSVEHLNITFRQHADPPR